MYNVQLKEEHGFIVVHPTFRVIDNCIQNKKTAEFIVYLNNYKQMYNYEQQFSISCLGAL